MIGKTLAHYEITGLLGKGGMGEVYRAVDSRLRRDVAIKILPLELTGDTERLMRLDREAQVLASLNHPNVAGIFQLEEAVLSEPADSGDRPVRFLVMELIEGTSLDQRLKQGPLPFEESLAVALGVARGLSAAHDRDVVHRDVKPANIRVDESGVASWTNPDRVKVLDFGLAKPTGQNDLNSDLTHSPTALAPTATGVILGTAPYMSPEQARGRPVDRRTDVWAFGCLLYEMLTGHRAFEAATVSDTIAAILRGEPDWQALPSRTPWTIRRLLTRCLARDPDQRLRDLGDAAFEIEDLLRGEDSPIGPATHKTSAASNRPLARRMPWIVAALAIASTVFSVFRNSSTDLSNDEPTQTLRFDLALPDEAPLQLGEHPAVALSPDGRLLVHRANDPTGTAQLYLHDLSRGTVTPLPNTEFARMPAFSPDGQWIAYGASLGWCKVSTRGGTPITLYPNRMFVRGADWLGNDTILLGGRLGISRLSANGGDPERFTNIDRSAGELSHYWPHVLPGAKAFLFVVGAAGSTSYDEARIALYDIETESYRTLIEGGTVPRYIDAGYIVFARAGMLYAAPFDLETLQVTGPEHMVQEGIMMRGDSGGAHYGVSRSGALAFVSGGAWELSTTLERRARDGTLLPFGTIREALYSEVHISPKGRHAALVRFGPNDDLWVADLERESVTRVTFGEGGAGTPVWSQDGRYLAFSLDHVDHDSNNIYVMRSDGSNLRRIQSSDNNQFPSSWIGSTLIFVELREPGGADIRAVEFDPEADGSPMAARDILATQFYETSADLSPDKRLLAYHSNESGAFEVYVRPFSGSGGKVRVSTAGGGSPRWSPSGDEVFWVSQGTLMAARVHADPELSVARAEPLFELPPLSQVSRLPFDVDPDGESFLCLRDAHTPDLRRVKLVLGWDDFVASTLARRAAGEPIR